MAKNNSPLNDGSWAREDADRAKKLYSEGHDAHAHALGIDEHDADYAKHWHTGEHRNYSGDGKARYSSHLNMWESESQIGKHMSSNLWGEAKRELTDTPVQDDLTGQRSAMPMKSPLNEQGYAAREDESIGARVGHKDTEQSWLDRRDESYHKWGHRPNQSIDR